MNGPGAVKYLQGLVTTVLRTRYGLWIRILFLILLFAPSATAQKTDIVIMNNGDRVTCEIKQLSNGKLQVKTDDMGTIYIKWNKIAQLTTKTIFEVEMQNGGLFYGSLTADTLDSRLEVITAVDTVELEMLPIVSLTPIKQSFWTRLKASVALGFSYTKASEVARLNLNGDASHRARQSDVSISLSTELTTQPEKDDSRRTSLRLQYIRFLKKRWSILGATSSEQNSELGLDLRMSGTGGVARDIIQSNENWLYFFAGLQGNREWVNGAENAQNNMEAPIGLAFSRFRYDAPEIDLSANATSFANLTTLGRIRIESDASLVWKFIKDFTLNLTFYMSFDNKPPSVGAAKIDFGTTVSLGYSYNK